MMVAGEGASDDPVDRDPATSGGGSISAASVSHPETGTQSTLEGALAEARPDDPVGLDISRSRVAEGLFGSTSGGGIGRFQLLARLSVGGMGVIYKAYDPQLERAVAVKLVLVPSKDGSGALAEAKALARLSHPNVVTVFDYGFAQERLYIVMELVLGETLKRWVKGRTQREILRAYRQAGEALAAAHAAGLVHRDFKPSNAIMGVDGRVRVVDFGLACEAADPSRPGQAVGRGGTPGYMAPEQLRRGPVTAAADQYGFCTALQEALGQTGERPGTASTPRWAQAVIDRGRSPNPADRFPSMVALLKALSRDPAVTRRRWIGGAGLVVAGAVAFVSGRATLASRENACGGGDARLAAMWGEQGEEAALERVATMSTYARLLVPRLRGVLSDHSRRWTAGYRDACLASARAEQLPDVTARRLACLERGRAALKSVAEIVRTTQVGDVSDLIRAVHALPEPDACGDLTALLSDADQPPADVAPRVAEQRSRLEEARIQIAAGRSKSARDLGRAAATTARELSYKPLLSEALLVEGHAILGTDDRAAAVAPLTESLTIALEEGRTSLAVEAWARRAWAHGTSMGGPDSLAGLEVIQPIAANQSTSPFARALLYNNVGCVQLGLENREGARAAFEQASGEARGVSGPGATELLTIDVNWGLVIDDPVARDKVLAGAVAERAKMLGDDHPDTLDARFLRGSLSVGFRQAEEILTPTCAALEVHGGIRATRCSLELGYIRRELGDERGAAAAMQQASSPALDSGAELPAVRGYLHLWHGDVVAASQEFAAALAALPPRGDEPWWERFDRADLELGRGRALRAAGDLEQARLVLSGVERELSAIATKNGSPNVARRLGRARAELAEVLLALHGSPRTIADLAGAAATWLRRAGGDEKEIALLERASTR
jgi:tetratricopeptide (TPR) repeat protein/predicted Ser/Thr protein kinase